jgi:hypothetical protein
MIMNALTTAPNATSETDINQYIKAFSTLISYIAEFTFTLPDVRGNINITLIRAEKYKRALIIVKLALTVLPWMQKGGKANALQGKSYNYVEES